MSSQEYSFTLTVPLGEVADAESLLDDAKKRYPYMRVSRKTDRKESARFYLSFPFSDARPDLKFQEWFGPLEKSGWDLFGPTYGRWGLL